MKVKHVSGVRFLSDREDSVWREAREAIDNNQVLSLFVEYSTLYNDLTQDEWRAILSKATNLKQFTCKCSRIIYKNRVRPDDSNVDCIEALEALPCLENVIIRNYDDKQGKILSAATRLMIKMTTLKQLNLWHMEFENESFKRFCDALSCLGKEVTINFDYGICLSDEHLLLLASALEKNSKISLSPTTAQICCQQWLQYMQRLASFAVANDQSLLSRFICFVLNIIRLIFKKFCDFLNINTPDHEAQVSTPQNNESSPCDSSFFRFSNYKFEQHKWDIDYNYDYNPSNSA